MSLRLMAHDARWRQEFEQSRSVLLQGTEGWLADIEHIGSTALPDVVARPVIDMVAGIRDLQGLNETAMLIEGLNYARLASPEWCEDELVAYLQKPRGTAATHRVYVVKYQGVLWNRCLEIRDHLDNNLNERQALETLKRDLFQPGCAAEREYEVQKAEFFRQLELRIE